MLKSKYFIISLLLSLLLITGCSTTSFVPIEEPFNVTLSNLEENGGVPVNIQDQNTRPFDIRINQILNVNLSLAESPIVNSYDLNLTDASSLNIGDSIAFLEQNGMPQLLFGDILNIVGNVITIDTPVPFMFTTANTVVFTFDNNINIDGSITEEIFTITNFFDEAIDITRFIFHCTDSTSMDDAKFCGDNPLTRGLVLRKKLNNTEYINYWNVKSNGDWGELAFDKSYDDKAPAGSFGFTTRLTYGGQSKHGVVIRLEPNQSIELVVQDDLTGIDTGSLMVEGHFIQN